MLEPIMNLLGTQRVILASSSPRRKEVLQKTGMKFEVINSLYEEDLNPVDYKDPADFVLATAENKVAEVCDRLHRQEEKFDLVIGADTIVYMNGRVYCKPKDELEAFEFMKDFSGKYHTVYTGCAVRHKSGMLRFAEKTNIHFGVLSDDAISAYIRTGEYKDKAGAYGIQGIGGSFVEKVDGDFYNAVGLPVHSLCKQLLALYSSQ